MAKDIGTTICKGIVVPFLPCLVAFWGFHPYMFCHFVKCFLLLVHIGIASMMRSDLLVEGHPVRVEWKSVWISSGERYAVTPGTILMLELFVNNLDIQQVCRNE